MYQDALRLSFASNFLFWCTNKTLSPEKHQEALGAQEQAKITLLEVAQCKDDAEIVEKRKLMLSHYLFLATTHFPRDR